ncbi:UDP-glucose 4-epimerase [Pseudanabaena sp. lw0831]|uniref:NAD-dependent epimerase/dehydratase family protein n=1 Tax=Pseudanabaena sp. lw0831 TaxID=1357935 RepID=UPI00191526D7|nr:NAD-dependent epimerase/dehydratase family protein [Pseudanabaena sp. lw0831]GBO52268.1 UDP-glucose 4-epimerase [Pseudanabaena sp. lw0831]
MKAIVIGGSGFIGSYITQELVKQNISTSVYDNFSTGNIKNLSSISSKIQIIKADVTDLDQLKTSMKGMNYVFHLAAQTSVTESLVDPFSTNQINNTGTLNVLWAALQAKVSRVIIASSCSVYGDVHQPPLQESYLPNPKSPYAASKLIAEALAESFYHSYGLETICLRYFNVYGLLQRADSDYAAVIPRFIECYRKKKAPQIYGSGHQSRDFIHVSDVARANIFAAKLSSSIASKNRVFNIGTGYQTSLLELLDVIRKQTNYYLEPIFLESRQGEVKHSCANIDLAQEKLGFQALVSLEEGIKTLL